MTVTFRQLLSVSESRRDAKIADAAARAMAEHCDRRIAEKDADLAACRAALAQAREALEPFSRQSVSNAMVRAPDTCAVTYSPGVTVADFRRARAAHARLASLRLATRTADAGKDEG